MGQKETRYGLDQSGLAPENLTTLAHLSVVRRQLQHFACYTAVGKSKFIQNLRDATGIYMEYDVNRRAAASSTSPTSLHE